MLIQGLFCTLILSPTGASFFCAACGATRYLPITTEMLLGKGLANVAETVLDTFFQWEEMHQSPLPFCTPPERPQSAEGEQ